MPMRAVILPTIIKTRRAMAEYTEQRNREFMRAVRREKQQRYERGEAVTVEGVIRAVLEQEAPGYYVSYRYARRAVGDLISRGVIERYSGKLRRHSRRDMMIEIGRKCKGIMERRGVRLGEALTEVLVGGRASSFFMTRAYAKQLYYREMCRREWMSG